MALGSGPLLRARLEVSNEHRSICVCDAKTFGDSVSGCSPGNVYLCALRECGLEYLAWSSFRISTLKRWLRCVFHIELDLLGYLVSAKKSGHSKRAIDTLPKRLPRR